MNEKICCPFIVKQLVHNCYGFYNICGYARHAFTSITEELLMNKVLAEMGDKMKKDNKELDMLAVAAKANNVEFERLLTMFKPFLSGQVSKQIGITTIYREEMMSVAMMAFHEAVQSYNLTKGHFYTLLINIVPKRLVDNYRSLKLRQIETIPIEIDGNDVMESSQPLIKASLEAYQEASRRNDLIAEIEEYKQELKKWDLTMKIVAENSPKQARTRAIYTYIVKCVAANDEIMNIIRNMHYYPVNKITKLTKSHQKTVERARIYTIAALIILTGDYEYLQSYIERD